MTLPFTISGTVLRAESMGKIGPFKSSGGNFYTFLVDSTSNVLHEIWKATDPTDSWFNVATVTTSNGSTAIAVVQDGDDLHIVTGRFTGANYEYHVFSMSSDSFTTSNEDVGVAPTVAITDPIVADIAVRSDGDIVIVFAGDPEKLKGTEYQRVSYVIKDGGGWGSETTVGGTGAEIDYTRPTIVRGESDKMHIVYQGLNEILHKSLTSGDSLSSAEAVNDEVSVGGPLRPVYYDDAGVERITAAWRQTVVGDGNGHIFTATIEDDVTPDAEEDASDNVGTFASPTHLIGSMAVDSKEVHLLYADDTDDDLYHDSNDDDGGWGTDVEVLDGPEIRTISSNVYDRSGSKLAYIYSDGGTIKYNEVDLAVGGGETHTVTLADSTAPADVDRLGPTTIRPESTVPTEFRVSGPVKPIPGLTPDSTTVADALVLSIIKLIELAEELTPEDALRLVLQNFVFLADSTTPTEALDLVLHSFQAIVEETTPTDALRLVLQNFQFLADSMEPADALRLVLQNFVFLADETTPEDAIRLVLQNFVFLADNLTPTDVLRLMPTTVKRESTTPTEKRVSGPTTIRRESTVPTEKRISGSTTVRRESTTPTDVLASLRVRIQALADNLTPTEKRISGPTTVRRESTTPTEALVLVLQNFVLLADELAPEDSLFLSIIKLIELAEDLTPADVLRLGPTTVRRESTEPTEFRVSGPVKPIPGLTPDSITVSDALRLVLQDFVFLIEQLVPTDALRLVLQNFVDLAVDSTTPAEELRLMPTTIRADSTTPTEALAVVLQNFLALADNLTPTEELRLMPTTIRRESTTLVDVLVAAIIEGAGEFLQILAEDLTPTEKRVSGPTTVRRESTTPTEALFVSIIKLIELAEDLTPTDALRLVLQNFVFLADSTTPAEALRFMPTHVIDESTTPTEALRIVLQNFVFLVGSTAPEDSLFLSIVKFIEFAENLTPTEALRLMPTHVLADSAAPTEELRLMPTHVLADSTTLVDVVVAGIIEIGDTFQVVLLETVALAAFPALGSQKVFGDSISVADLVGVRRGSASRARRMTSVTQSKPLAGMAAVTQVKPLADMAPKPRNVEI